MEKLKSFDLWVFTILMILCEFLSSFFFKQFSSGFYLSFASLVFIILSIRWGWMSIFPFILSGIPLIFTQSIGVVHGILYYCIANTFAVIPILIYGKRNRNKISQNHWYMILYSLLVLVSLSLGKGLIMYILNGDIKGAYGYFVSMIFTFVINIILLLLFTSGKFNHKLVYDMNEYLKEQRALMQEKDLGLKIKENPDNSCDDINDLEFSLTKVKKNDEEKGVINNGT